MSSCKRKFSDDELDEYEKVKIKHDNSIFEDLKYKLNESQREELEDFLDIFYYLIVNYSKNCYKYWSRWQKNKKTWNKNFIPNFDYEGANLNNSHKDLLEIQKQMFTYRNQYRQKTNPKEEIFTTEFINNITTFINESLHIFYTSVINPLNYINPNILTKLKHYNSIYIKKPKKSNKINYDVLENLIKSGQLMT